MSLPKTSRLSREQTELGRLDFSYHVDGHIKPER